jgi:hypothetical protein
VSKRPTIDLDLLSTVFPDGVASRAELLKLGMFPSGISHRCRPGGPWRRVVPGVVLLHSGTPTRHQLAKVALAHAGRGGVLTGIEAARLHGVSRVPSDGRVHVLIPHKRKVASWGPVIIERTRKMPVPTLRQEIPLAPLPRAIIDAAHRLENLDLIRTMVADAVQHQRCDPADLVRELVAGSTIGSARPRRVLAEIQDGVRSAAEAWARSLVKRSSLPAPEWNVELRGPDGRLLGIADAYWRKVGLIWEIDSKEFHLTPDGYARTLAKHGRLTASGFVVVHTLPARLRTDPLGVLSDLQGAYRLAESRLTPPAQAA